MTGKNGEGDKRKTVAPSAFFRASNPLRIFLGKYMLGIFMARYMHPTMDGAGRQGNIAELRGRKILEIRPDMMRMVDSICRMMNKLATPQELLLVASEWIPAASRMNAEEADIYGIEHTAALFGKVNTAFEMETRRNPNGLTNQLSAARDALWDLLCRMREKEPQEGGRVA